VRELTADELAVFARAEKRRLAAAHYGIRQSAVTGEIAFIEDLLTSIDQAPAALRAKLEPHLLEEKARLLRTSLGLPLVVRFFYESFSELIADLSEAE
jgi:hypothetical protein